MGKIKLNAGGFTLIELIFVLIISGLLVLFGSMGINQMLDNYLSQKKSNAEMAYKGQLAMLRISKEIKTLASAISGGANAIEYQNYRNGVLETHKLSWSGIDGDPLLYDDFFLKGNSLTDSVKNFALLYYDSYNDKTPGAVWTSSTKLIGVTLELTGTNDIPTCFTGKITPRNLPGF